MEDCLEIIGSERKIGGKFKKLILFKLRHLLRTLNGKNENTEITTDIVGFLTPFFNSCNINQFSIA